MAERLLLLLALLLLLLLQCASAADGVHSFQSDELSEEDEWGLVGGTTTPSSTAGSTPSSSKSTFAEASDGNKVQFALEHAFGSSDFTPAGTFTARLRPSSRGGQALVKIRLSRNDLSPSEQAAFKELLQQDGFYTIRVPATPLNPGSTFVMSSTKARCLGAANLKDRFDIHLEQGNIIAVGYSADAECAYPRVLKYPSRWTFSSHIVSKGGEQASRMVLLNELEAAPGETLGDEDLGLKKTVPEKSFFAKYWLYFVPLGLIIINTITQVANMQEEPAGGQGAQGAGQARVANAGAARRR